jgi:hypothetical protein
MEPIDKLELVLLILWLVLGASAGLVVLFLKRRSRRDGR